MALAAMPEDFRVFVNFAHDEVDSLAAKPDAVWHDNIFHTGGVSSSAGWFHSHKLTRDAKGKLRHVSGAVRTPIAAGLWLCHGALADGDHDAVRRWLVELSHYTVDATTLPHVTRELTNDEHRRFEQIVRDRLPDLAPSIEAEVLLLPHSRDVGGSVPDVCRETYLNQYPRVRVALDANNLANQDALLADIVIRCVGFTMAFWLDLWQGIKMPPRKEDLVAVRARTPIDSRA